MTRRKRIKAPYHVVYRLNIEWPDCGDLVVRTPETHMVAAKLVPGEAEIMSGEHWHMSVK